MDTLDKIMPTKPISEAAKPDVSETGVSGAEASDQLDLDGSDDTEAKVASINWWKIAGYTAAGLAVAAGGYAYWRAQQKKPQTRLERLRRDLGLNSVDFSSLPTSLRDIDLARLDLSRRKLGTYAKKATHIGAKKVAELTR